MRYCFDLDGTISENKKDGQSYEDVIPLPGSVDTINRLKESGHYIIIFTARNMVTHNNNLGKIISNQAPIVIEWLKKYNIPYDELLFGKPHYDYIIDDKAIQFKSWDDLNENLFID